MITSEPRQDRPGILGIGYELEPREGLVDHSIRKSVKFRLIHRPDVNAFKSKRHETNTYCQPGSLDANARAFSSITSNRSDSLNVKA
jgi:hypothetical protein